jgi:zinc protease
MIYLIDRPGSPQSIITAGQVLRVKGRDDVVALRAANDIIGGSFLSRVNFDLRETKGWSYGSRTSIATQEGPLTFTVSAPVQTDKTGPSIAAIREQLTGYLGAKGTTAAELERTVNNSIRELPGSFETSGDVLAGVSNIVTLGRPDDYYETLAQKYRGMTAASLDATARAEIDPSKLVWVVVGDAKTVRPQLDALGLPVEITPAPAAE